LQRNRGISGAFVQSGVKLCTRQAMWVAAVGGKRGPSRQARDG